jgi:predicted MFS family arabinose efflux permease
MVMTMSQALIGSLFEVQERPKILGFQMAGFAVAYVIGPHIINFFDDWRLAFSFFMFPLTLVSLVLAFRGLPSPPGDKLSSQKYLQAFRAVFQNKSAMACVIANVVFGLVISVLHVYGIPFYREHFLVDKTLMSMLVTASSLSFVVGGVIGGRLVNRFGRKPLTILGMLLAGVQTLVYLIMPNLWLSLALWIPSGFAVSVRNAGYSSLTLEQVPAYRGTMMSLSQFSANVAGALGSGLGGLILVTLGYGPMGVLGIAAIVAAVIIHFFTIDPTQQMKRTHT